MDRLKISVRMTLAFMAMMALLLLLGAVALWGSSTQSTVLSEITQSQIPVIRTLNNITDGANEQAIQFRNLGLFPSEKIQSSARAVIQKSRSEVSAEVETLQKHAVSEQGSALVEKLKQGRAAFHKFGNEFLELLDKNQRDDALVLLETKLRPTQLEYQNVIREILDLQTKDSERASQQAEAAARDLSRNVLITSVVAMALAIFLVLQLPVRSLARWPKPLQLQIAWQVATSVSKFQ